MAEDRIICALIFFGFNILEPESRVAPGRIVEVRE